MEINNQEKTSEVQEGINNGLKKAVEKLETSLSDIKSKIGQSDSKSQQMKEKMKDRVETLKDSAKDLKTKYQETDPLKQMLIIAGISAAIATIVTAVGLRDSGYNRKRHDR